MSLPHRNKPERILTYILHDRVPIPCADKAKFRHWMDNKDRHVDDTFLCGWDGQPVRVSTVFLGIDHSFGHGRPILWETQVFGGPFSGEIRRYRQWAEAEEGHRQMVKMLQEWAPK